MRWPSAKDSSRLAARPNRANPLRSLRQQQVDQGVTPQQPAVAAGLKHQGIEEVVVVAGCPEVGTVSQGDTVALR